MWATLAGAEWFIMVLMLSSENLTKNIMTLFQHTLQVLILTALVASGLVILAALFGGYIAPRDAWQTVTGSLPALFALVLVLLALVLTDEIQDLHGATRFNSMALASGCGVLTVWAWRVNQRVKRVRGKSIRRISGTAWALIIATGVMTVIESLNLVLWSATDPVVWGVIWLVVIFVLQVAVFVLGFTRQRAVAAYRVQPDSAAYHPNGSANAYPDAGYYRLRVAPGKPDSRRHPNPRGDRRPVSNPPAGSYTNARPSSRPAHAPRKP